MLTSNVLKRFSQEFLQPDEEDFNDLRHPERFEEVEKRQPKTAGLEAEADLKQFLKVVRPEWSVVRPGGGNQLQQVVDKLRSIGITDTQSFVDRVFSGAINTDLFAIGRTRFSQQTLETVKRHKPLMQALENASKGGPYLRQTGPLNPVKSLLSKNFLGLQPSSSPIGRSLVLGRSASAGASSPRRVRAHSPTSGGSLPSTPLRLDGPPRDKRQYCLLPHLLGNSNNPVVEVENQPEEASPRKATRFAEEATAPKGEPQPLSWASLKAEARVPGWQEDGHALCLTHGEDMLKEQSILHDMSVLMRMIHKNNPGVRMHVIGNVKARLQREKEKGAADAISMDQRLFSIRSNIENMSTSRRELARVRSQWAVIKKMEDPRPDPPPMSADLAVHMKNTMLGKKEEHQRKRMMSLALRNSGQMDPAEAEKAVALAKRGSMSGGTASQRRRSTRSGSHESHRRRSKTAG